MKGITERLMNTVLQCAKTIKTQTKLSSGTVSVSFAAIQYLKEKLLQPQQASIAIIGTGKIGSSTCKNLIDYLGSRNITLVNRSEEKACQLAHALQIQYASFSALHHVIKNVDVVIVATNASQPVLQAYHVADEKSRILIDLSIPQNIHIAARSLPNIEYVQVDDLSKINDATLQQRIAEVPKAKQIIVNAIHDFAAWLYERKQAATLRTAREKLIALHRCPYLTSAQNSSQYNEPSIQKIINQMAVNIRQQPAQQQGCYFLKVMNDYITNNLQ
jgi:glutamyl-tRNA reductase